MWSFWLLGKVEFFPTASCKSELHGNVPGYSLNLQFRQTFPSGFFVSGELSIDQVCSRSACLLVG